MDTPQASVDLEEALRRGLKRPRDRKAMEEAAQRMDELRADVRRRYGEIPATIIREIRDE
jgi:hypothetical protein